MTVNSKQNSDLYWAIRGGGGSTWGIITSITIKAYKYPANGFAVWNPTWSGNFCNSNKLLNTVIDSYTAWGLNLTSKMATQIVFSPTYTGKATDCNATWTVYMYFVY